MGLSRTKDYWTKDYMTKDWVLRTVDRPIASRHAHRIAAFFIRCRPCWRRLSGLLAPSFLLHLLHTIVLILFILLVVTSTTWSLLLLLNRNVCVRGSRKSMACAEQRTSQDRNAGTHTLANRLQSAQVFMLDTDNESNNNRLIRPIRASSELCWPVT